MTELPKVQVLLSTYNGDKYIEEQIKSIILQESVDVHILIRDDGSTDLTLERIKRLKKIYPDKIEFYQGSNKGYKKSFFDLVKNTNTDFDYYAFSDQDDYWLPQKLKKAINILDKSSERVKLYTSTVIIADEKLHPLYKKNISNLKNTFGSALTRIRLAGCTYVFSKETLQLVKGLKIENITNNQMPSHDGLLFTMCEAVNGFVFVDNESYILHRRRSESVTSGGNGLFKRIKIEAKMIFKDRNDKSCIVQILKDNLKNKIPSENMKLINEILSYRSSFINRIALTSNPDLNSGLILANVERNIKIFLGYF